MPGRHGSGYVEQYFTSLRAIHTASSALSAPAEKLDEIELVIDDTPVRVPKGASVLQACEAVGVDVPRFCYHQKLSVAGNCRMCLVEVAKAPKPVASCAMPAAPGMNVRTNTELVKKAREGVMEFLLINHPLDCPICDQGGECDLQEQSILFGQDRSRFVEAKRAVSDKNLGPLVKTVMTRCIHCTRCVRFAKEVAGVEDLGMTGRGNASEIGTYVDKLMTSEISGNVIDLCPVGALTSKPYAFTARPWELKHTESIDTSDAMGAAIRVDSRGPEVMRIVPRQNDAVNEDWISDKARFQYDGLKRQRLGMPMVKGPNGLAPASWADALAAVQRGLEGVQGSEMKAIAGKLADAESMMALKDLMNRLGCSNTQHEALPVDIDADARGSYIANSTIAGLEKADYVLIIGSNPRVEAPVYNARIRKMFLNGCKVGVIGEPVDLTYAYTHLGASAKDIKKSAASEFAKAMKAGAHPMIIVGPGVLHRADYKAVMKDIYDLAASTGVVRDGWNGFNMLQECASAVAALDLGFVPSPAPAAQPKFVYLLGADDFSDDHVPAGAFVVYQGHHGDKGASRADVVLPGAAYTEKAGTYVNFEGRVQQTRTAISVPGDARDDWKIVRAVSEFAGVALPYDSQEGVAARLADVSPTFLPQFRNKVQEGCLWLNGEYSKTLKGATQDAPLASRVKTFFMTDAVSRASQSMARAVQAHAAAQK